MTWALQEPGKKGMYHLLLSSTVPWVFLSTLHLTPFTCLTVHKKEKCPPDRLQKAFSTFWQEAEFPGGPMLWTLCLSVVCSVSLTVTRFLVGFVILSCDVQWGFPSGNLVLLGSPEILHLFLLITNRLIFF